MLDRFKKNNDKEIINIDSKPVNELCSYFDITPEDNLFSHSKVANYS
jgi:hypothetical protein